MTSLTPKPSQIESWDRLPSDWQNDERMDALFSFFKDRDLNAVHYDAKMKFWSETIIDYCEDHGLLQIDIPTIVSRFRRKGRTPKCLDKIFEELTKQNRLISTNDYANSQQSWSSWTFNKLASPLTGWMSPRTPIDQEVFIIKELVDKKAQQVIDTLQSNVYVPTFDCVVSFSTFIDTCRRCTLIDENSINLIISTLTKDKKILIDHIGDAKDVKVVKFIMPGTSIVRPLTEIETSVLLLRHSKQRLEEQLKKTDQQIEGLLADIYRHLKNSNRTAAKKLLRKKKLLELEHDKKENMIEHLNSVLTQIEQTDCSSLIINAYSSGVQAHKELLRKNGLTPDAVEDMIDEVHEMLDTQNEIDEALRRPVTNDTTDMTELEDELEELLKQPIPPTPATSLPINVDITNTPITDDVVKVPETDPFADLELRLQKLGVQEPEHVWLVKFPHKDNYLLHIQKSFPLIDLLQHDYDQSSYVFLIPNNYLSDFTHFIHRLHGSYRIITNNPEKTWKKSQRRSKRWVPSDNPLDQTYYQHFLSYDEQQDWYNLLKTSLLTKKFIRSYTIGHTYENRTLTIIKILGHSHRRHQQRKHAIYIDGGMHAREWLSIGVANYILIQFLKLRKTNVKVREILYNFDIYMLPLMNPDGYEFSRHENRLWRKNRSPTTHSDFWNGDQSCYGIDLNRNFPYEWNNTIGASDHACSHSYRGPSPASENEVISVVTFLRQQQLSNQKFYAYFNLHAYGRFWLLPWTYSLSKKVSNYDELFNRSSKVVSSVMKKTYRVGQASRLLYPCTGTSIDFAATLMPHAMTFELSPMFKGLPMCFDQNKTLDDTCTVGFLTDPKEIEIDGTEIFNAIVEYMYSIIRDRCL
ncbi:unnamed protein product [Adineta steineri]|uniref:Peptidase M14 domain-containing protein n=1 Tax=Adineta steineri TaxID=433720 RepID=A0A814E5Z8_9BILA|nr:unnamed protein product [Adineta steineri]CAF3481903.1 unnamed protein product [Adineta steineri]